MIAHIALLADAHAGLSVKTKASSSPSPSPVLLASAASSSASSCFSDLRPRAPAFLALAAAALPFLLSSALSDSSSSCANAGSRDFCMHGGATSVSFRSRSRACASAHLQVDEVAEEVRLSQQVRETLDGVRSLHHMVLHTSATAAAEMA